MTDFLTQDLLKSVLDYEPHTGRFIWRAQDRLGMRRAGMEAGYLSPGGKRNKKPQWRIEVFGKVYLRSRLAWLWMTGTWPILEIDHRDNDPMNDRWENLREATRSQNCANKPRQTNNKSGFKGVHSRRGGYIAQIYHRGKKIHLGKFTTPEAAHVAYAAKSIEIYGEFARP